MLEGQEKPSASFQEDEDDSGGSVAVIQAPPAQEQVSVSTIPSSDQVVPALVLEARV